MTLKSFYIHIGVLLALCFVVAACSDETEDARRKAQGCLVLQFSMAAPLETRAAAEVESHIYYTIKESGAVMDSVRYALPTRVAGTPGDGVPSDGGGMDNLMVFLVDSKDKIIGRKEVAITSDDEKKIKSVTFEGVETGVYTVYAYANYVGNDWFALPPASETSFANYKDAVLKPVSASQAPSYNGGMPLTGKKEVVVGFSTNSEQIEMLRPVVRLTITAVNSRSKGVEVTSASLGEFIPATGYVFEHEGILPKDASYSYAGVSGSNVYEALPAMEEAVPLLSNEEHGVCEMLLYESQSESYRLTLGYTHNIAIDDNIDWGSNVDIKEKDIKTFMRVKDKDLYLRLREDGVLDVVPYASVDDGCYWLIGGAGNQNRSLVNNRNGLLREIDIKNNSYSFEIVADISSAKNWHNIATVSSTEFRFGGKGKSAWLKENGEMQEVGVVGSESAATIFTLTTFAADGGMEGSTSTDVQLSVPGTGGAVLQNLTKMLRNQKINLHVKFE